MPKAKLNHYKKTKIIKTKNLFLNNSYLVIFSMHFFRKKNNIDFRYLIFIC